MQERHRKKELYFKEQVDSTQKFVVPYILEYMNLDEDTRVLEVGCGVGGNMVPFIERGCEVIGVDISENKINYARQFLADYLQSNKVELHLEDVYNMNPDSVGSFDLIILRDVLEHIPNQDRFLKFLKEFLSDDGVIFIGFPPWKMPFGGHQQNCRSKFLSRLPYFHLLPKGLFVLILNIFNEPPGLKQSLLNTRSTGISIERYQKILRKHNYRIRKFTLYLINPNYEVKFGIKGRKQFFPMSKIPWLRNFFTTCVYSLIGK